MGEQNKLRIKDNINQLREMFLFLFPQNRTEIFLFLGLLILYLPYSLLFLFNSHVVDNPFQAYDIIFSFDNCVMFHQGAAGVETHPLLTIFMQPLMYLAVAAHKLFGFKAMGVVMVSVFTMLVSMGVVYTNRYLRIIVGLTKFPLWLITCMYAFFFTNMILCFIVESYSISVCLLAFTALFYSYFLKKKKEIKLLPLTIITFVLGGVTVTNGMKGVFPYLFTYGKFKKKLIRAFWVGLAFVISMFAVLLIYYDPALVKAFIEFRLGYTDWDLNMSAAKFYENFIDLFLGSPIFSSSVIKVMFNEGRFSVIGMTIDNAARPVIIQDFYRHFWQYLWVAIFYIAILYSIIKNYKNPLVQLLLSFWILDFLVHVIIGYGLGEGFIFGGHWIYITPMLLAWGYKNISGRGKLIYTTVLSILTISLIINNLTQLRETYLLAVELFLPIYP